MISVGKLEEGSLDRNSKELVSSLQHEEKASAIMCKRQCAELPYERRLQNNIDVREKIFNNTVYSLQLKRKRSTIRMRNFWKIVNSIIINYNSIIIL